MSKSRGFFIVFEGLDGSGTTTQARLFHHYLSEKGAAAVLTCEPTDEPVGKLIRDALTGRVVSPRSNEPVKLSEDALCLLFAADRVEHSRWIEGARDMGTHVVCDRYVLSSIAYQSLDPAISPERVVEVNQGIAVPDLTFMLKVPVDQCLQRLEQRNDSPTIYEEKAFLQGIDKNYESTSALYQKNYGPMMTIDGTLPVDEVHRIIVEKTSQRLSL